MLFSNGDHRQCFQMLRDYGKSSYLWQYEKELSLCKGRMLTRIWLSYLKGVGIPALRGCSVGLLLVVVDQVMQEDETNWEQVLR